MTVPFMVKVPGFHDVEVDATGDIEISVDGGYYGDMVDRTFIADELMAIAAFATRHKAAYDAYKASDYVDEDAYFAAMPEVARG